MILWAVFLEKGSLMIFFFSWEKNSYLSVHIRSASLGFRDGTWIDSCSLFICKCCYSKIKWLGIISHRLLFLKEQCLVLVGYLNSLKEIVFPGEKERRGEDKVISSFDCLSLFYSNRKTFKWFSQCLVTSRLMDECISLRNSIACKLMSHASLFSFFLFFPPLIILWLPVKSLGEDFWFSKLLSSTRSTCPFLQLPPVTWGQKWSNRTSWHWGPTDGWRSSELQMLVALVLPRHCCTCGWAAGLYRKLEVVGQLKSTQSDPHHLGRALMAQLSTSDLFG